MSIFYGDKKYGIRWTSFNTDNYNNSTLEINFELQFQIITDLHIHLIKDALQKVKNNDNIIYYFQRIIHTTQEWCSNSDEVVYYTWVKCSRENIEKFIQENENK